VRAPPKSVGRGKRPSDRSRSLSTGPRSGDHRSSQVRQDSERVLSAVGRIGLGGRTLFYLLLVYLTASIAVDGSISRQDNAHGALEIASSSTFGKVAIGGIALGFVLFGVARLYCAVRIKKMSRWQRATTYVQGLFYIGLAYVPASFLAGNSQAGSEQQQHRTAAKLLDLPAGQEITFAVGLVFVGVCVYQIVTVVKRDFADGLELEGTPGWVRRLVMRAGMIGIVARAIVFLPIGVFFMVAAVQFDPNHADGLDAELLSLARHQWGTIALAVVAAGLAAFVVFSALETRYRTVVERSDGGSSNAGSRS
jgi:hypothetical protein